MIINVDNVEYQPQRIFCVGRNYRAHIQELNNDLPKTPVIFCKPASSLVSHEVAEIPYPRHGGKPHFETELVVLIGNSGIPIDNEAAKRLIAGLGIGLDLTLREVQTELIAKALPWEKSKGFDASAPLGKILPFDPATDLNNLTFSCAVNGIPRQHGNSANMIFTIPEIMLEIARYWSFLPGDLIFTGTPQGVGALDRGDIIEINSELFGKYSWKLA